MWSQYHTSSNWISFNSAYEWNPFEVRWITELFTPLNGKLGENNVINIIRPAHISGDDILEHITFRIFNKLTDVRDLPFVRHRDYHAYLWGNDIKFITQYEKKNKLVVF
jgi:hypothetical protein